MVFIGGRGCGKTMLLRYLTHRSAFSPARVHISASDLDHIGIYWRPDTQFASMMTQRSLADDEWISAFNHWTALVLSEDVLQSVLSLSKSSYKHLDLADLENLDLSSLCAFDSELPTRFGPLLSELQLRLKQFVTWVNNARRTPPPPVLARQCLRQGAN